MRVAYGPVVGLLLGGERVVLVMESAPARQVCFVSCSASRKQYTAQAEYVLLVAYCMVQ